MQGRFFSRRRPTGGGASLAAGYVRTGLRPVETEESERKNLPTILTLIHGGVRHRGDPIRTCKCPGGGGVALLYVAGDEIV